MSHRLTVWIGLLILVLGCAVAGFYWVHQRSEASHILSDSGTSDAPDMANAGHRAPETADNKPVVESVRSAETSPDTRKPAADSTSPLRAGEALQYTATVAKLSNVANLLLKITERRNFNGKSAWHLQAFAHTENPLRMVFALDDQFDSYSDANTLTSFQYEMHLNERGQKADSVQRLISNSREPAPENASAARVLPGTRDPLGMMQYLRSVDWNKTPEVHGPVYDGRKLYDVRAKQISKSESVSVPAGKYTASKIEIRVFDDGQEMKDTHFALYLKNDGTQTPVLLEAIIPFANARVELVKSSVNSAN